MSQKNIAEAALQDIFNTAVEQVAYLLTLDLSIAGIRYNKNTLRTYPKNKGLYAVTAVSVGGGAVEKGLGPALLRPHFTVTLSLSISSPLAHA